MPPEPGCEFAVPNVMLTRTVDRTVVEPRAGRCGRSATGSARIAQINVAVDDRGRRLIWRLQTEAAPGVCGRAVGNQDRGAAGRGREIERSCRCRRGRSNFVEDSDQLRQHFRQRCARRHIFSTSDRWTCPSKEVRTIAGCRFVDGHRTDRMRIPVVNAIELMITPPLAVPLPNARDRNRRVSQGR
jgi:hypothetical protein